MIICRDISIQKKIAAGLIEAKNEALKSSSAKDIFLANISHEIRTPLAAIIGFAELLGKDAIDESAQRKIQVISRNGLHLLQLINDILDISVITSDQVKSHKTSFQPRELINQIFDTIKNATERKVLKFESFINTDVPERLIGEATHLTQIISNVLGNAIKFTETGTITTEVGYINNRFTVTIEDKGQGIPFDCQDSIFNPFMQVDMASSRKFEGSGLGLAIARKLAQKHNGDVKLIRSAVGEGSTFEISIPYEQDNSKQPTLSGKVEAKTVDFSSAKILIVEDHSDIAQLLKLYLEYVNANVFVVNDGDECLAFENLDDLQVIVMDLQMPRKDGYETMRALKARNFSGKVIAVSAHANGSEKKRCIDHGFYTFVSKPVNITALYASIDSALNEQPEIAP